MVNITNETNPFSIGLHNYYDHFVINSKNLKPIRERAETSGVAKSTVWFILKKKEHTGELRKQLWWTTEEEKTPSQQLA